MNTQQGPVIPFAAVQPDKIAYSGTTQLTLALEGTAPLRVEIPKDAEKLLAPASAAVWRIQPIGPAKIASLPEGRERWEQAYKLSPFFPGEKVTIAFAPIKVSTGSELNSLEVTFPTKEVRVQTTIVEAKAENARPVTGIEELPTTLPPTPDAIGWQFVAALGAVFAAVLMAVLIRKSRAKPLPVPPQVWASRELDRLERDHALERVDGLEAAGRLAAIVRDFVERRFGLVATKLTTSELARECEQANWKTEWIALVREILERCDRAKFAGDAPTATEVAEAIDRSRRLSRFTP